MADNQDRIDQLLARMEQLVSKQNAFVKELRAMRDEINALDAEQKTKARYQPSPSKPAASTPQQDETLNRPKPAATTPKPAPQDTTPTTGAEAPVYRTAAPVVPPAQSTTGPTPRRAKPAKSTSDWEKFIGENLILKIGILITVIGIAVGVKYSIDEGLLSPLTRIILGYIAGAGLLGFGMKLKAKYERFSAALVSGAMASFYFITFAAYSFYDLFPQAMAFGMMVLFTAFTVMAAIQYNRQTIAILGLVGAYAVPFALSDNSGQVEVLFSYMAIINIGILIISFKRDWKPLYYISFAATWLIYFAWWLMDYYKDDHLALATTFLLLFYVIFYVIFLAYKLIKNEPFRISDVVMLLLNSLIFYGIGYNLVSDMSYGDELLGLFTLFNALMHFIVAVIIYRRDLADRNLFYLASGLVMAFITIAIPVQLDGEWVTLLWAAQAAILFYIGRAKQVAIYEKLAYPLIILATLSLIQDWGDAYDSYWRDYETLFSAVLNVHFLGSIIFLATMGLILYWQRSSRYSSSLVQGGKAHWLHSVGLYLVPVVLLAMTFFTFYQEIGHYWTKLYRGAQAGLDLMQNYSEESQNVRSLLYFRDVWQLNYTLLFFSLFTVFNLVKLRKRSIGYWNLGLNVLGLLSFLTVGLYVLSELRESYIAQQAIEGQVASTGLLYIRYVSFVFVAGLVFSIRQLVMAGRSSEDSPGSQALLGANFKPAFYLLMHITILWIASSELLHWLDLYGYADSYKLALSILWGSYSLLLISIGIYTGNRFLRIAAMGLFAVTLIKLFFYDISALDTLSKTIVFVSLGVLLLIISFLYNKYKTKIADEN